MSCGPRLARRPVLAGGIACFVSAGARAQSRLHRRIALLSAGPPPSDNPSWAAFFSSLRGLGYGPDDLVIEGRGAQGHNERLPGLAAELVALAPEVIVTASSAAALAASQATRTIPIVTAFTADFVGTGLATSVAHPGGNVTGLSNIQEQVLAKELQLLKTAAPHAARVAVLANPANPSYPGELQALREAAGTLGVELRMFEVHAPDDLGGGFAAMAAARAEALVVFADPMLVGNAGRIAELAAAGRLPAIYGVRQHVAAGGLMSYGPDLEDSLRRAAGYVDRILKGARPADLPVEWPTRFDLAVNLKTARDLGLVIPPSILSAADVIIE